MIITVLDQLRKIHQQPCETFTKCYQTLKHTTTMKTTSKKKTMKHIQKPTTAKINNVLPSN